MRLSKGDIILQIGSENRIFVLEIIDRGIEIEKYISKKTFFKTISKLLYTNCKNSYNIKDGDEHEWYIPKYLNLDLGWRKWNKISSKEKEDMFDNIMVELL